MRRIFWAGVGAAAALVGQRKLARRLAEQPVAEAAWDLAQVAGRGAQEVLGVGARVVRRRLAEAVQAGREHASATQETLTRRYLEVPRAPSRRSGPRAGSRPLASPGVGQPEVRRPGRERATRSVPRRSGR
jgi:hypothetical protein